MTATQHRLLLRPEEAAAELGISRARVYELLRDSSIPSITIGKSRRIAMRDLEQFVEQQRHAAGVAH